MHMLNLLNESIINILRPRPNGHFQAHFLELKYLIPIKISLKFDPKGSITNIPALVQIMAWRRSGDKPLSEPMMVNLPTHKCVTRHQWVKIIFLKMSNYQLATNKCLIWCCPWETLDTQFISDHSVFRRRSLILHCPSIFPRNYITLKQTWTIFQRDFGH